MVELSKISAGIVEKKIEDVDVNLVIKQSCEQLKKLTEIEDVEIIIRSLNYSFFYLKDTNQARKVLDWGCLL